VKTLHIQVKVVRSEVGGGRVARRVQRSGCTGGLADSQERRG